LYFPITYVKLTPPH